MPVCTQAGCPVLVTSSGHCPTHKRDRDRARGSRQARGYDSNHDRLRKAWAPRVATGQVPCAKCGQPIAATDAWDLGHTNDRLGWTGPECLPCNRGEAGRKAHN